MKKSWITNPRGSKDSYREKNKKSKPDLIKGMVNDKKFSYDDKGHKEAIEYAVKLMQEKKPVDFKWQDKKYSKNNIIKEGDGSFGAGGGTVFTSSNAGIFTPTHTDRSKRPKKRKSTGISRLGDFITDHSPERKMRKADNFLVDLVKWVTLELRKKDKKRLTQQTSSSEINDQIPRVDWKKEEDKNPVEFDAEPDDQADVKQNDETDRIKTLDDNQGEDNDKPKDTGNASLASPAGLTVNLAWESGGYQSDELFTGGYKDKKQGEVRDSKDEHSDEKFVKNS